MKDYTRRSIAFIAGKTINNDVSSVYDYANSKFCSFSGTVTTNNVKIYDYEQSCFIGGSLHKLYHYKHGKFISLKVQGEHIEGYDYDSGNFYSGTIRGKSISIYDYEFSKYYEYKLQ